MHSNKPLFPTLLLAFVGLLMMACSGSASAPKEAAASDELPAIYPDYTNVTVPSNIAPLNFMLPDSLYDDCVATFTTPDGSTFTFGQDNKVVIPDEAWQTIKQAALGQSVKVQVYGAKERKWTAFKPFEICISKDEIDPYISYRLIQPSYGFYDKMNISERNVSNFDERVIFNNKVACPEKTGQCINCHSYQNYSTENMLFHGRVTHGGTIIMQNGEAKKVNLKREGMISAGVYPSWHPSEALIAFSVDDTNQWFHTSDVNKVEVFDYKSDLVLYDIKADKVTTICADTTRLEVFPAWAPDGKYLYYCSCSQWRPDSTNSGDYRLEYESVHYNLYRRSFDLATRQFGEEEVVYQADSIGRSVSLPRLSPDGRFITFAEGDYGYFNIWHKESDIRILDLSTGQLVPSDEMNSPQFAESYPSFSSNGKWVMCASRRDDGNYSRIYIAYFDGKKAHKAFLLPQDDPDHNTFRLQSYNRPEFMKEPVRISISALAAVVGKDE